MQRLSFPALAVCLLGLPLITFACLFGCAPELTSSTAQPLDPAPVYPWQIHHVVVQTEHPGEGVQCGGAYHFLSGGCTCTGAPVPGYLDPNAYLPVWRCGPCPTSELPRLHLTCLRGPPDQLNPVALLNGHPWPSF